MMKRIEGFSLLEAVVSLAILGMGLGALMQALSSSAVLTEQAQKKYDATMRAQLLIDQVGIDFPFEQAEYDGEEADFTWHLSVSPLQGDQETEGPGTIGYVYLFEINAEVTWILGNQSQSVELSTIRPPRDPGVFGSSL
jgi:general secretion pathway protein I